MAVNVRPVEYFYAIVEDKPGEAYRFLSDLAQHSINLLAFNGLSNGALALGQTIYAPDRSGDIQIAACIVSGRKMKLER